MQRSTLRQHIRQQRQRLSQQEQENASQCVLRHLQQQPQIKQAQHIAVYLSHDGELNTEPLIDWLWQQNKTLYLPILHPFRKGHLLFQQYTNTTPLTPNDYGILEPTLNVTQICPIAQLDLILTPLVAFDSTGQRLGMGGGFYDRTFPHTKAFRLGIGHDCQQVEQLSSEVWDKRLHAMLTPKRSWQFVG